MPCDSSYQNPNEWEAESLRVCKLIVNFSPDPVPRWVREAADSRYGCPARLDEATQLLCEMCQKLPDSAVHNGYSRKARDLANWWDEHQEHDRVRKRDETTAKRKKKLRKKLREQLSEEEWDAIEDGE